MIDPIGTGSQPSQPRQPGQARQPSQPRQPRQSRPLRLAMLGMVEGNGHPYSWSAIFNGYDREAMVNCGYPAIPVYLGNQPPGSFGIDGAKVTHIWTDRREDSESVAAAAHIPNVVERAEEIIGEVDAVLIATDIGSEHVECCRPFVEAGLPIFVDKPLIDNARDMDVFDDWVRHGARILSTSSMRYAKEFLPYRLSTSSLGELRFATVTTPKSWERYGIHALEAIYPIVGPGFVSVRNTGSRERNVVHLKHRRGADIVIAATADMYGAFGLLQLCGTAGSATIQFQDTFYAFKAQLAAFVDYVQTGIRPFPYAETQELMALVTGGIASREQGGAEIEVTFEPVPDRNAGQGGEAWNGQGKQRQ